MTENSKPKRKRSCGPPRSEFEKGPAGQIAYHRSQARNHNAAADAIVAEQREIAKARKQAADDLLSSLDAGLDEE